MDIDKWIVMKILQEKGLVSYDEYNYKEMDVSLEYFSLIKEDFIVITFLGDIREHIPFIYYKDFKRKYKIDEILKQ